ncbi:aliphatic sulfonate ABC transporter substrate-binding protein [Oceanobacillus jeddahense]|uniref:Aliphatic sulfonate ABC transporter substrate-binding protein n=1 Tax=Oceanobacillus jeddahense TaxID=1462527 RepID=A0ABY5JST1_9BACI|nr:aliphatic sulfonate ABC transporter substrate-binding protein [Oceanobacillus jeddahense]UUI03351.1 aliphatic sulfonate ABC transporter substrate-binding protein [Oceanobacillus jeddahense]
MRKLLYALMTFSFVAILAACGADSTSNASEDGETIRLGYQKGNTMNLLKAHGTLDEALNEAGYNVEWKEFAMGAPLIEALNTDNIDFGHSSDVHSVLMQSGGHNVNYVASESPYPEGVALLSREGSGIETLEDLKGKVVGVTNGGNQHYLLLESLKQAGIDWDEVEMKFYKDASEGLMAFSNDEFDVFGTWDPFYAIVEDQNDTHMILDGTDLIENRTFYLARDGFADEQPEALTIILEELENMDQWANEEKREAAEILAEELGLEPEPLEVANERRQFGVQRMTEEVIANQQQLADTFYEAGLIENEISVQEAVDVYDLDESVFPDNIE